MDDFGIEKPMNFDMPLNKETKPNKLCPVGWVVKYSDSFSGEG